jgi:UDP-GlcNAc:undecaprenyl-phosphate GlcNAc-1-phosphate transferase
MTDFGISMAVCSILILMLRNVAHQLDLMDHPGGRKLHEYPTPTVGGLAMFVAVLASLLVTNGLYDDTRTLLECGAALLVLGVLDDKHGLSVRTRMMIQVFIVTAVIVGANGIVTHLGGGLGVDIPLGMLAIPFSVVAFVGGVNAINMIDGVDGMAGKMAMITTLGVAAVFYLAGASQLLPLTWAMLGALVGFLFFNSRFFVKRAWVFMGNAGSMWLGLVLGWFMAQVTQGKVCAEPALVLWLFGIPLLDTLAVMMRRIRRKQSPFMADRTHIHHVFERNGYSTRRAVLILTVAQLVIVGTGVILYLVHAPALVVFWGFVVLMLAYYYRLRNDAQAARIGRYNQSSDSAR